MLRQDRVGRGRVAAPAEGGEPAEREQREGSQVRLEAAERLFGRRDAHGPEERVRLVGVVDRRPRDQEDARRRRSQVGRLEDRPRQRAHGQELAAARVLDVLDLVDDHEHPARLDLGEQLGLHRVATIDVSPVIVEVFAQRQHPVLGLTAPGAPQRREPDGVLDGQAVPVPHVQPLREHRERRDHDDLPEAATFRQRSGRVRLAAPQRAQVQRDGRGGQDRVQASHVGRLPRLEHDRRRRGGRLDRTRRPLPPSLTRRNGVRRTRKFRHDAWVCLCIAWRHHPTSRPSYFVVLSDLDLDEES